MHVYTRGTLATLKSLVKMSDLKIILASIIIIYRQLQEYCWTARGHTKDRGNYNRLLAGFSSYRSVASSIGKLRSECNSKALNLIGNHPPNDIMWLYMYVCILYWSMLWSVLIWSSSAAGAWPMMYSCRRCSYIQVAQTSCPEQARHRGCNWTSLSVTNRAKVYHQGCIILHDLCSNTWRGVATVHCCVPSAIIMLHDINWAFVITAWFTRMEHQGWNLSPCCQPVLWLILQLMILHPARLWPCTN